MKENNVLKRLLSVFLTVAMVVSLVAVVEPAGLAQAAEAVDVYSEDFESGAVLTTHAGSGSQENRLETETNSYLQLTGLTATQLATPGISVEENTEYILSYRVKAANVSGNFYFYTWGQAWNDSNEYSSLETVPGAIQTATDGWQTVQGTYTFSKNHVQFIFEEAWGGSADVCLDDITLTNTATGEIAYLESFDATEALTVRSGSPTQTQVQEELPEYYLQLTGASAHSVKTEGISIEANTEYVLSYRVKVDNVSGSAYFYTWRQEWDDEGNYSGGLATTEGIKETTDGWQTVEVSFTSEKNHVQFFFEQAWSGSADICLDDITLKAVGSETAAYYEDFTTQQALTVHSAGNGGSQAFVQDGNHYLALLGASGYSVKTDGISLEAGAEYALSYRVKLESVSDSVYFYIWRQEWDDEGNYSGLINEREDEKGYLYADCIICGYRRYTTPIEGNFELRELQAVSYLYAENVKNYLIGQNASPDEYLVSEYCNGIMAAESPVVIGWTSEANVDRFEVVCSRNADFREDDEEPNKVYTVNKNQRSVDIYNLYPGTKYYVKVTEVFMDANQPSKELVTSFETGDIPTRVIHVDGLTNVRDLGGYTTSLVAGGATKQGMIYRGSALEDETRQLAITGEGKEVFLNDLGIKTEIELRDTGSFVSPLSSKLTYLQLPIAVYNEVFNENQAATRKSYQELMEILANKENYPVYIHCQQGDDRTGTVAFFLNALLGVEYNDLCIDYEMTSFSPSGLRGARNGQNYSNHFMDIYSGLMSFGKAAENAEPSGDMPISVCAENFFKSLGVTEDTIEAIRRINIEGYE